MNITSTMHEFAAEISDVDLKSPLSDATYAALHETIDVHAVAVFRNQFLADAELVAFAERLGRLEVPLKRDQYGGVHSQVTKLANVDNDGRVMKRDSSHAVYMKGNLLWHTDSSFKPIPCSYSLLAAHEVPARGGNTEFADARAAYDDWKGPFGDWAKEDLENLSCEHSIVYSRSLISGDIFSDSEKKEFAPVRQPLVRSHPRTGRKVYYVGSHCAGVVGWNQDQGRALVSELTSFCVEPQRVYAHEWRVGDLVIWDNRSLLHRGLPYDPTERRVMHRATVAGDKPLL